MAYSMDFREAVARAYDECDSSAEVAEQFGCSASWVRRLIQHRRERGTLEPRSTARTDEQRTYGRAPPGERVVSKVPHGHWKVLSTIAASAAVSA